MGGLRANPNKQHEKATNCKKECEAKITVENIFVKG